MLCLTDATISVDILPSFVRACQPWKAPLFLGFDKIVSHVKKSVGLSINQSINQSIWHFLNFRKNGCKLSLQRRLWSFGWTSVSFDRSMAETRNDPRGLRASLAFRVAQASVSKRGWVRSRWYENDFLFSCKSKIKNSFSKKGFALSLVLKVRILGTRKWPISVVANSNSI